VKSKPGIGLGPEEEEEEEEDLFVFNDTSPCLFTQNAQLLFDCCYCYCCLIVFVLHRCARVCGAQWGGGEEGGIYRVPRKTDSESPFEFRPFLFLFQFSFNMCMYTCAYTHTHTHTHSFVNMYTHTHTHTHTHNTSLSHYGGRHGTKPANLFCSMSFGFFSFCVFFSFPCLSG